MDNPPVKKCSVFGQRGKYQARFIRFGVVGVLNTLVDYGVFWALTHHGGVWLMGANTLSFSCAALNSYLLNKYWTFGHKTRPGLREFRNYIAVVLAGFAVSSLSLYILAHGLGPYGAKAVSIALTMLWNYFGVRRVLNIKEEA
jgi:putative flippase GtrA